MGYKMRITQKAEQDLEAILTYMAVDLKNIEAAMHFADEVEVRYDKLSQNPYLYEECRPPLLKQAHYRKVVIGNYLLIYRIDMDENTVFIERFFSELQDYFTKL